MAKLVPEHDKGTNLVQMTNTCIHIVDDMFHEMYCGEMTLIYSCTPQIRHIDSDNKQSEVKKTSD